MTSHYICGICGRNVVTFDSWKDVEPSDVVDRMTEELESHNVNTSDLDAIAILSRFRIDDDEAADGLGQDGAWVGQ